MAPHFLPPTNSKYGRASKKRSHYLYRCPDPIDKACIQLTDENNAMIVELRLGGGGKGSQSVMPGSVHTSGEHYEWDEDGAQGEATCAILHKAVKKIAAAVILFRHWPAHGRHEAALRVGGFLARAGWDADEIGQFIFAVQDLAGDDREHIENCREGATASVERLSQGGFVYGFPALKEQFGETVAKKIAEHLDYSTPQEVVDPVDLWGRFDPPPLPSDLLPEPIETFAREQGSLMGCDPAGLAMSALAICAATIPDSIKIKPKRHEPWKESARIWTALVGDPSSMKSAMMRTTASPLARLDADMWRAYSDARTRYEELSRDERRTAPKPKQTRLRIEDTTIEAAQEILKDSPDGVLLLRDEISGWFGAMDKYAGSRGAATDRGFWLQAYNGGSYAYNRVSRGSGLVENLSVTILGGIQPGPMRKIAEDSLDDGLMQRVIMVMVRGATMGRDEPMSNAAEKYESLIPKLREQTPPFDCLAFDDGAMIVRSRLEQKHIDLMGCESVSKKLAEHIGKYNGIFARLCVIWHCVENLGCEELPALVTVQTAERVAEFMHKFLLPHALAFYAGVLGLSDDHERLTAVAGYILSRRLEWITNRDVQRGDRKMRNIDRWNIDSVFNQLDALGWLFRIPGARPADPPRWKVNPEVHRRFEERAAREAARRQQEREMIADILGQRADDKP